MMYERSNFLVHWIKIEFQRRPFVIQNYLFILFIALQANGASAFDFELTSALMSTVETDYHISIVFC